MKLLRGSSPLDLFLTHKSGGLPRSGGAAEDARRAPPCGVQRTSGRSHDLLLAEHLGMVDGPFKLMKEYRFTEIDLADAVHP
jgi:hypothetical protein